MVLNELELEKINAGGKEYPIAYNLNVQSRLQKKFGSLKKWIELIFPTEKDDDEQEADFEAIIITAKELINEGIDIENDSRNEKRDYISQAEAGRIISEIGIAELTRRLLEISTKSKEENKEENEEKNG